MFPVLALKKKEKVYFWPSNYCLSLILAIQLENRVYLTTQLSKPLILSHQVVLVGSFDDVADTVAAGR